MERMFVIYGQQNCGKTHTSWMVLNHLLEYGAELLWFKKGVEQYTLDEVLNHPGSISDYRALLLFNGKKIAAWSNGDLLKDFRYDMNWALEQGADYVICASRGQDRANSVYRELMTKYRGNILDDKDWFWVDKIGGQMWLYKKDYLARQIARRVCFDEEYGMTRTIWPVGHGAFYSETFETKEQTFSVVYDCGGDKDAVKKCIDWFVAEQTHGNIKPIIQYLFISHFHEDHINGIAQLLDATQVQNLIIPQMDNRKYAEAFMQNLLTMSRDEILGSDVLDLLIQLESNTYNGNVVEVQPVEKVLKDKAQHKECDYNRPLANKIPSGLPICDQSLKSFYREHPWIYIPVNVYCSVGDMERLNKLVQKLRELEDEEHINGQLVLENGDVNLSALREFASREKGLDKLKGIYKSVFGNRENVYSMPVYSGPAHFHFYREADAELTNSFYDGRVLMSPHVYHDYIHHIKRAVACLYMGDFNGNEQLDGKTKLEVMEDSLKGYWYSIGMQQIPHHASKYNHMKELYQNQKVCFANVKDTNDRSYTHSVIRDIVARNCIPWVVTEADERFVMWIY